MENNVLDYAGDIFGDDPIEHLVKILQNASPMAVRNAIDSLFKDYSILEIAIENSLEMDADAILKNYQDKITLSKQDLAIKLMSEILSQE